MNPVPSPSCAWLQGDGGLLVQASAGSNDFPWNSSITRLITGINAEFGEERYRLLRKRIHTTATVSDWDRNLVKVCAKRLSCDSKLVPPGYRTIDVGKDLGPDPSSDRSAKWWNVPGKYMQTIDWLADIVRAEMDDWQDRERHQSHRPVAAALFAASGELIAANVNTNAGMQMRHAEVNLLLAMASRGILRIPAGAVLYVTLKPCRMCASLINLLADSKAPVRVIALNDDTGPHGRHTMLPGLELIVNEKI